MLKTVDGMLSKMRGLKRKLSDLSNQSSTATSVATTRLSHLSSLPESIEAPAYPAWARRRLSHQLTDYFLRSTPPLKDSAMALAKEEGIDELVDLQLWEELAKAENGLRQGRLEEVLGWVAENRTALRKMKVSSARSACSGSWGLTLILYSHLSSSRSTSKRTSSFAGLVPSLLRLPTPKRTSRPRRCLRWEPAVAVRRWRSSAARWRFSHTLPTRRAASTRFASRTTSISCAY
jgi:hypothetical protein